MKKRKEKSEGVRLREKNSRGGGTRLSCGRGGAAGGRKPDPVAMCSVHKNTPCHNIPYQKKTHMHTLSQYCTVAQLARMIPKCAKISFNSILMSRSEIMGLFDT